jgi:hypothetical protein
LSAIEEQKKKKLEVEEKRKHEKVKKQKNVEQDMTAVALLKTFKEQEVAKSTQDNVKKPRRLKKMFDQEPTVMNQNSQDAVAEKGYDIDSIITIASDSEDETDVNIPLGFKQYEEICEFEAAPENGRLFLSLFPVKCSKDYNTCFHSFGKKEDGSIAYVEEHRLIRRKYDVLVGLNNGVHTEGWSLDKVRNRVKKLITESPTATIKFTFMDLVLAGGQTDENRDLYPSALVDQVDVSAEPANSKIRGSD